MFLVFRVFLVIPAFLVHRAFLVLRAFLAVSPVAFLVALLAALLPR